MAQQNDQKPGAFLLSALVSSALRSLPQPCFSLKFVATATLSQQCPNADEHFCLVLFVLVEVERWFSLEGNTELLPKAKSSRYQQTSQGSGPWRHPQHLSFSNIPHSISQDILSAVPSKRVLKLTTSHLFHDSSLCNGAPTFVLSSYSQIKRVITPQFC